MSNNSLDTYRFTQQFPEVDGLLHSFELNDDKQIKLESQCLSYFVEGLPRASSTNWVLKKNEITTLKT